ncbi:MAG: TetR/AcrR family transcriptional regulator [Solirubrobacteraceae bacterium]
MTSTARTPTRRGPRLGVDDWIGGALDLIGEEGLTAVKIDRLAQRLGVTKGSFYWHFEDLASFLATVAERWCAGREELRVMLDALEKLPPRERLVRMVELVMDARHWRLERAAREWARTSTRVRNTLARSDRWILDTERRAFVELGFSPHEAEVRANTLFYAGMGFILTGPADAQLERDQVESLLQVLSQRPG